MDLMASLLWPIRRVLSDAPYRGERKVAYCHYLVYKDDFPSAGNFGSKSFRYVDVRPTGQLLNGASTLQSALAGNNRLLPTCAASAVSGAGEELLPGRHTSARFQIICLLQQDVDYLL